MSIIENQFDDAVASYATPIETFTQNDTQNNQLSIIEDNSEQLLIDRKTQFRNAKKFVGMHLGQKIAFGSNSLLVKKMTRKFINMIEIQNGLIHEHKRHDMIAAAKYINYKKSLFARSSSSKQMILENQSSQYYQQMQNIADLEDDIRYLLNLMYEESNCSLSYNIVFDIDSVRLNIEDGTSISIYFRYETTEAKLAISHDINLSNIFCTESLQLITFLQLVSNLVLGSTKASLEFKDYMFRMQTGKLQLEKLVSISTDFEIDNTFKAEIVQHIEKAKLGDTVTKIIGDHMFDNVTYTRTFIIRKLTKVRTIIELIAKSSDSDIIEYRSTIMKISHNILDNADKILKIHNALK